MRTIALHTLGCKLNYAETATIGRQFQRAGYEIVPLEHGADVVVLNTCSVTERADRECRQIVRRALRTAPHAFVAVVGCYAQLKPREIASIEGVDLVGGTADKFELLSHVGDGAKNPRPVVLAGDASTLTTAITASSAGSERTRAFLKVQDGCDYSCSFCTIPEARGKSRSVPGHRVVEEARALVGEGYREIVLTGVNTGDYGSRIGRTLLDLLRSLLAVQGLERLRISSIEPNLLSDELLSFWFGEARLCKHWHMPLQSGSDAVLGRMRRRYRTEWYSERVRRIVAALPEAAIGADVIVGFPGETDVEFEETEKFLKELPLAYLHVFTYSERPGTAAETMPDHVPMPVRAERSERLRLLSQRKRFLFHNQFVGRVVKVLVEGQAERGTIGGLTDEYVRVKWPAEQGTPEGMVPVTIVSANHDSCLGRPVTQTEGLQRSASHVA